MEKKFHKKNLKRKHKFFRRLPTLWEIIDEKSRQSLLEVKARAMVFEKKNHNKHKTKDEQ